ncbi:MAG: DUF465 domain-containing protein [Acidobacteria bacterium]|nr:MAG: DUF465 domain-containing protein [Acidobacteriota bacterium]REK00093.1 MAG: DUF465 domain-containing protein [Acidobacteriota bacterium]
MSYESIKAELLKNDAEFKRLYQEHQDCEGRLESIQEQGNLSADEETQAKAIKLHKLALKDRMESIIRSHSAT